MLFVHFFHLFLLILPSHLFAAALDVLDIGSHFRVLSHLSELFAMIFFGLELAFLVFIEPGD